MRVTVVRGGGVAGMVVTTTLDSADLDDDAAASLRRLLGASTFADRPPSGRPDATRVEIDVDDDGVAGRVRYDDGDAPEGVAALVSAVLDSPHSRRTIGR